MASPAEARPPNLGELETAEFVEASLGLRAHLYVVDGEEVEIPDPGNFEPLVDAYIFNRYGIRLEEKALNNIESNQRFLRQDALGKLVSLALDEIYEHDQALVHDTIKEYRGPICRKIGYAILLEEVSAHLPPELNADILRDRRSD